MAYDSNRGRDLPRAPQFKPIKGKPKSEEIGDPTKLARDRERVSKALASVTQAYGYNTLLEPWAMVRPLIVVPDKVKQKEHKLDLEALSLGLTVHPEMLKKYGLQHQPNPQVPPSDPNESPF